MSEERIAAIRARVEQATPRPWRYTVNGFGRSFVVADERDMPFTEADARFIAHSRDDVPFLLAELENQAEVIRHLQDAALTLQTMRDEARAAALAAADGYDGYPKSPGRRAAEYVAKRIREAVAPRQPEGEKGG